MRRKRCEVDHRTQLRTGHGSPEGLSRYLRVTVRQKRRMEACGDQLRWRSQAVEEHDIGRAIGRHGSLGACRTFGREVS